MTQNRKPPAYQEYASEMLASVKFRAMSLETRGLLYTLRLECWANQKLPSEVGLLSKVLGIEVTQELLVAASTFFEIVDGQITCPELDDYRVHLDDQRRRKSEGGKLGAKTTNRKRRSRNKSKSTSTSAGNSQVCRQGSGESLVQLRPEKKSQNQLIREKDFNYLNQDGTDPLLNDLPTHQVAVCPKCDGEGCGYCEK